jgi:3-mercaptopyruvate sulfurtransferase SseA
VLSCQSGARSAFAAKALGELGYEDVRSLKGGFSGWKAGGYAWESPAVLDADKRRRYSRHLLIPRSARRARSSC